MKIDRYFMPRRHRRRLPPDKVPVRPSPEMIAAADMRLVAPRSLTALLMGDPEPGRKWPDGRSAA